MTSAALRIPARWKMRRVSPELYGAGEKHSTSLSVAKRLENARKYNRPGRVVCELVTARREADEVCCLSAKPAGQSREAQKYIFERISPRAWNSLACFGGQGSVGT